MKKIIISVLSVLLVALTVGICYMKFSSEGNEQKVDKKVEHKNEVKENKDVIQDTKNELDEPSNSGGSETPSEEVVNKNTESTNNEVKQSSQSQSPSSDNSQTTKPVIPPTPTTPKEEEGKPAQPVPEEPKVDPEYERLRKLAVFKTFEECDEMGLKLGLEYSSDLNTNYRNTMCSSVAYDGKLLGYSLKIYYLDSTYSYYQG